MSEVRDGSATELSREAAEHDFRSWLRDKKDFPHLWCPGCGLGIILGALIRTFDKLDYDKNDLALVSGIGCTGRIPVYVDCHTLHTTHGRALTFATGIKLAKPRLKVIVFMGDGDALAIGGNHFLHASRRNIDLTAVIVNNSIYGMTGGQASPTTPHMKRSTTTPWGQFAQAFDPCEIAKVAGASFVARSTAAHSIHMQRIFAEAMEHKGFSVVEIMSNCGTCYGRLNKCGSQVDMLKSFRERTTRYKEGMQWSRAGAAADEPYVIGVLHHNPDALEFLDQKTEALGHADEDARDA